MKRLFSMLLLCCAINTYGQQANKPIDKLTDKMIGAFDKFDTVRNLYVGIVNAALVSFDPETSPFVDAWKEYEQRFPTSSNQQLMKKMYDTVINKFYQSLAGKTAADNQKYSELMELYLQASCNCFTEKFKGIGVAFGRMKMMNKCDDSLLKDKKYKAKFEALAKKIPNADRTRIGHLFEKNMALRCPAYKKSGTEYVFDEVFAQYEDLAGFMADYVYREPAYFYHYKKMDSLALLFPSYKKYEADIKSAVLMDTMSNAFSEGPVPFSSKEGTKVVTFYKIEKGDIKVVGQLAISYSRTKPVKVLTYTFTLPAKIKNLADVTKKVREEMYERIWGGLEEDDIGF